MSAVDNDLCMLDNPPFDLPQTGDPECQMFLTSDVSGSCISLITSLTKPYRTVIMLGLAIPFP